MELPKTYDPKKVEDKIYYLWQKSGFFNPDKLPGKRKKTFTIIMPPPNANGSLHIGHAVFVTLQDIMTRYKRMRGFKTLWLPGADHAGFETQVVFDKKLEKEGRNRFQMSERSEGREMNEVHRTPREQLYQEMLQFTLENKKIMEGQLRKLGASCDWSREKFTLDQDIVQKTQEAFIKLYENGLIYRGERIINWCPKHQTALADLETKHIEKKDRLYYLKYGPFEIATVRPETKFGDKYVVTHPKDRRYAQYKNGQKIEVKWINGPITATILKDDVIETEFGSGAMTITPWHDPIDFELAERRGLQKEQIIDKQGKLLPIAGEFAGMSIEKARPLIVEKLKSQGLLTRVEENYNHKVAVCYKCGTPIEPQVMPQWFLRLTARPYAQNQKSLRDLAVEAVKSGKIKFIPKRMEKIFFHWMKNLRDWNISRQIIWGIRIPAWYRKKSKFKIQNLKFDEEIYVGNKPPVGKGWAQDPDVLDTWFSSGQWPFLALGYPDSKDYKTFYPTDAMETGWDILFFWVARMIMLGLYVTKKVPFRHVYLHGLVRDKERQKMSKSKGNVIDPLGVVDIYGADALRMALIVGNAPGNDPIIYEEKIRGYRNFANKIWNASRFVLMNLDGWNSNVKPKLNLSDKKILKNLNNLTREISELMDSFKFYRAAEKLYHYFWHTFADKIIEKQKERLKSSNKNERLASQYLLLEILQTNLKLLHPFMPFITEEIYQQLPPKNKKKFLMIESWP